VYKSLQLLNSGNRRNLLIKDMFHGAIFLKTCNAAMMTKIIAIWRRRVTRPQFLFATCNAGSR